MTIRDFAATLGLPTTLAAIGGREHHVPEILSKVVASTGRVWTNVRPVKLDDLQPILIAAL